jgi:pyruvate-ferredoxin/flavodoxin oxidoreductase
MHGALAPRLLHDLAPRLGEPLAEAILVAPQIRESEILIQRGRVAELKRRLAIPARSISSPCSTI